MVTTAETGGRGDATAPARRRLPAAERRESILRAAAEVFAQAGYRAAKVSDVAERVGVTEPVIFQNFGSKAALYAAVLDRMAGQTQAGLEALTDHHGSSPWPLAPVRRPGTWRTCSAGPRTGGWATTRRATVPGTRALSMQVPGTACCSPTRRR
jgi:AcrR family transcriptional regulator